jgi:5'-nucleotidase/UDP-sugar diphosphatase
MVDQASTPITLVMAESLDEVRRKGVPHVVDFTVLQLNDVYEAPPVEGGRLGGIARCTTLRRKLAAENPNFFSVMIGDFLSPSPIGATTGDSGQHMIEALNSMGLDYATVGNHEFDIPEDDLLLRIEESRFKWIVSNVTNGKGEPFKHVDRNAVLEFANDSGEKVRVALIGVCLDAVKKPWIKYQNVIESAREQVAELESRSDVFIAMTHLTMPEDHQLGASVPRLDVLMGGHEHEAARAIVGDDATPIFKADSNARSAFVHHFRFDTQTRTTKLFTELVPIDSRFEEASETAAIVKKWQDITFATLRAQGNEPLEVVGSTKETLHGYEADVRNRSTNLTQLIAETFLESVPDADCVVFPSGFVRIDGNIVPGDLTYYDVVKIFPVGGKLSVLKVPGLMLGQLLKMGAASKGTGGFQVVANITQDASGGWLIKGEPLVQDRVYKVVYSELPASALSYPPFKGSGITKEYDTKDMRAILTDRLRRDHAKLSA